MERRKWRGRSGGGSWLPYTRKGERSNSLSGTGPVGGWGRSEDVSLRMEAAVECSKERREEGWGQISAS